jgi:hypothetical protein
LWREENRRKTLKVREKTNQLNSLLSTSMGIKPGTKRNEMLHERNVLEIDWDVCTHVSVLFIIVFRMVKII